MRAMRVKSVAGQERRQARRGRPAGGQWGRLQRTAVEDSGTGNDVDGAEAEDT